MADVGLLSLSDFSFRFKNKIVTCSFYVVDCFNPFEEVMMCLQRFVVSHFFSLCWTILDILTNSCKSLYCNKNKSLLRDGNPKVNSIKYKLHIDIQISPRSSPLSTTLVWFGFMMFNANFMWQCMAKTESSKCPKKIKNKMIRSISYIVPQFW